MLLASLLLKLGGYGIIRFLLPLQYGVNLYLPLVALFATLGVIYGSLATCVQTDLKRVIAYSSVAHMNLVMLGLISCNEQGVGGAIVLMVGHAVVSSALFFCVGVLYSRHHSRQISYYSGVVGVMPLFTSFFLLFSLANMGFPGTSNFAGEILLLTGLFKGNTMLLVLASSGIVFSAAYSI